MPELTTGLGALLLTCGLGYLVGSVPFGIVMARLFGLGDLRQIGSGNIGATNVLRTGNRSAAALTLILDAAKGALAVLVARWLTGGEDAAQLAGFAAFVGHLWPVWVGFKGGKGVATFLGILLALYWPLGLIACAIWLFAAFLSRISSLGALASAVLAPIAGVLMGQTLVLLLTLALAVMVVWRHKANIARLMQGTEPRFGRRNEGP